MKRLISSLLSAALLTAPFTPAPLRTSSASPAADKLSSETLEYYKEWKNTYLYSDPYVSDDTQYYVFYGDQTYEQAHTEVPVTVSEAHGYGMLITALMSDYDSDAKDIFDGMYRYYLAHPSSIGPHLMAWQQSDNGRELVDSNGCDSATDGDLDIAYALLLADSIWGSDSGTDYRRAAELVLNDIMEYDVSHTDNILRLGDWAYDVDENDKYFTATRASDFIMQYFPVFAAVTGDERWNTLYDNTYSIINGFVDRYHTGLLPDFIVKDSSGSWIPAPAYFLEDDSDGNYYYNSCRTPWRIGTDAIVGNNKDAKRYAETVNSFFKTATGGDPEMIMAGYTPDGNAVSDWDDLCFTAPLMLTAACAGDTEWHDAIRSEVIDIGIDSYFGNTIAMLCLITDDGGWIVPETSDLTGDVNMDGDLSIADVILLQKWLLGSDSSEFKNWKAGDINSDSRLDVFDLILLKRKVFTKHRNLAYQ
ncbi:MAG: hypothetical protein IKO47_13015 [Ruminococcus sp.]|nr:hypothetical protein [Ruminococcus sp.]